MYCCYLLVRGLELLQDYFILFSFISDFFLLLFSTPYCQLSCHFGTLNVQTINNGRSNDGETIHIVVYKVCLKDAKLSLSSGN